jgi:protein-S-isoprenylcysteine O-methyltransferase Ste14
VSWTRVARRIRVPVSFLLAAVYLWQAHPTARALAIGSAIAFCGLALRALASGHVRKDAQLTTTGPYAYTRNPLYLGSLVVVAGFAVAAWNPWLAAGVLLLFFLIYLPTIRNEEEYLRRTFPAFAEYERGVPRLLPRLRAPKPAGGEFSRQLYLQHREYNAILGAAAMLAALIVKLLWPLR